MRMPRARLTVQWMMVAVAVVAFALGGVALVGRLGRAESESQYRRRLADLAYCLFIYRDANGHLPPAGIMRSALDLSPDRGPGSRAAGPLFSWRVEVWAMRDKMPEPWDPSRPWDDPANSGLAALSAVYTSHDLWPDARGGLFPQTSILAITGPGTAFGDGAAPPLSLQAVPPDTIVAVESRASGVPWPAPGDFDIRTMPATIDAAHGAGISGRIPGGFHVIFADGELWFLGNEVPFATLQKLFTVDGAMTNDRQDLLGRYTRRRGR